MLRKGIHVDVNVSMTLATTACLGLCNYTSSRSASLPRSAHFDLLPSLTGERSLRLLRLLGGCGVSNHFLGLLWDKWASVMAQNMTATRRKNAVMDITDK